MTTPSDAAELARGSVPAAESWHAAAWSQLYSGRAFRPFTAREEDIDAIDIARSLSMTCRYNGHVRKFYSVAEHAVLMARYMLLHPPQHKTADEVRELALWCLLHDGAEAYIGDMVRPLKITPRFEAYRELDDKLTSLIAVKYELPVFDGQLIPAEVKVLDNRILLDERLELLTEPPEAWQEEGLAPLGVEILGWYPPEAEREFLRLLDELDGSRW